MKFKKLTSAVLAAVLAFTVFAGVGGMSPLKNVAKADGEILSWTGEYGIEVSSTWEITGSTFSETTSDGIALSPDNDLWNATVTIADLDAVATMTTPTLVVARKTNEESTFNIKDKDYNWLEGWTDFGCPSQALTYEIADKTVDTYHVQCQGDIITGVYIIDAGKAQTKYDYQSIDEAIAQFSGKLTVVIDYTYDLSSAQTWTYFKIVYGENVYVTGDNGIIFGSGTITLTLDADTLESLQHEEYVGVATENAKIDNISFIPTLEEKSVYSQTTPVTDGTYSKRWVALLSADEAKDIDSLTLTLTRSSESDSSITGSKTVTLSKSYKSVSAAGSKISAPEGYVFVAYAMTDIPEGVTVTGSIDFE